VQKQETTVFTIHQTTWELMPYPSAGFNALWTVGPLLSSSTG
jgi:hypothetical protein